jgi:hypothetical protein
MSGKVVGFTAVAALPKSGSISGRIAAVTFGKATGARPYAVSPAALCRCEFAAARLLGSLKMGCSNGSPCRQ